MSTVVRFENVSKQYSLGVSRTSVLATLTRSLQALVSTNACKQPDQKFWALRHVSFELSAGDCLGLIGQNGAGKSTILKLLANITRPTSGKIVVNGRLSALIELGSGFHPDLTGRENVFLNGTVLGLKRSELARRFDEIVAFSEIEKFIDTPVKRYSSGMLVRLGFAVASCIEPDVLLVDEVLAVGDASFRQKCLRRIHSLLDNGTTIIFVSHNLHMVQAVCPFSLYVEHGHIKLHGSTADVIDAYERDLQQASVQKHSGDTALETPTEGSSVHITGVEILDEDGASSAVFRNDRPVQIRVCYSASWPIAEVNAVVRIVRSDGLTCCRIRSRIDDAPLALEGGIGMFYLALEALQLVGASYCVTVSLRTELELVVLAEGKSGWFYVTGAQTNDSEYSGIFEPQRKWIMNPDVLPAIMRYPHRSEVSAASV
jgi:lipopolysaccharide transport system ATP-binding protein